ncbi:MAG: nuclear transport factor 2 family protein [Phycisphaerales bacterium]|nr:nuclear transport factor 2 family protein [Phycisphaerales bacterium]
MSDIVIAASLCVAAILGVANQASAQAAAPEKEAREAVAQFYTALNALFTGDMKPMNDVWSHADDVTYMGPAGGFQVGWKNVSEELVHQAAMKLGGKIEPSDIHVIAFGGALAIVSNYEKGENINTAGKKFPVSIRVTTTFRCEGGKWKMIGHHTDLLPSLVK